MKFRTGIFQFLALLGLVCSLVLPTKAVANEPCHDYGTPYDGTQYSMGYVGILCGQETLNAMDQAIAEYPAIWDAAQQNPIDDGNSNNSSDETCFDFGTPYGGQVETLGYIGLVCGQENITWMNQLISDYYNEWNASQQSGGSENSSGQTCHDYGTPFSGTEYSMGYIGVLCGQENLSAMDLAIGAHQAAWYAAQQNGIGNENTEPSFNVPLMPPTLIPPICASFTILPSYCVPSSNSSNSGNTSSSGTQLNPSGANLPTVENAKEKIAADLEKSKEEISATNKKVESTKPSIGSKAKKSASNKTSAKNSASTSINCKKGKKTIIVKGKNSKCPTGYKKVA